MVLDDRRMKPETIGISKGRVGYILHDDLIWKSFAEDECRACSQQIENSLAWKSLNSAWRFFKKKLTNYVRRFITMEETWIHHYTSESKQQSKQ